MLGKIRDLGEMPQGSIHKQIQTIVLVGIGALVLLSAFFSHPNQAPRAKTAVSNMTPAAGADSDRIRQAKQDLDDKLKTLENQGVQ